ncbi:MAG TPA: hypothetical protein VFN89_05105 [Solirubrobacterales bacterium]|nr:hypothetical protein [Solirubrobacterales bacterium]
MGTAALAKAATSASAAKIAAKAPIGSAARLVDVDPAVDAFAWRLT